MYTPSQEYWQDLEAYDGQLHATAQARAGGWWRHDAQDLWHPEMPATPQQLLDTKNGLHTSWQGYRVWGARNITGHLTVGQLVRPFKLDPLAEQSILRTMYSYSLNKLPFPGSNHVRIARYVDQAPAWQEEPERDMDTVFRDVMTEKKIGMTAMRVPEEPDFQQLLRQMKLGASGLLRASFD